MTAPALVVVISHRGHAGAAFHTTRDAFRAGFYIGLTSIDSAVSVMASNGEWTWVSSPLPPIVPVQQHT